MRRLGRDEQMEVSLSGISPAWLTSTAAGVSGANADNAAAQKNCAADFDAAKQAVTDFREPAAARASPLSTAAVEVTSFRRRGLARPGL
jgi:hypothetical protein